MVQTIQALHGSTAMSIPPQPVLPPLVSFDRVSKRYGAGRPALDGVSFAVGRSEFLLVTGPSGAGKSTLLRLIAALDPPTTGTIVVGGEDLARIRRRALPLLRRSIGIVMQDLLLLADRSVLDNVALPALASGLAAREARERARAALARVGLDAAVESARPDTLSGGEQQRAALARAIVNRPGLVLADEPTAHLDQQSAAKLLQLLEQFVVAGVTVILATHGESLPLPARARVLRLDAGRIVR
jgi:cell division transport system ATP-binding protein